MKIKAGTVIKVLVGAAAIAVGIAQQKLADKELKSTVADEVAKALSDKTKES